MTPVRKQQHAEANGHRPDYIVATYDFRVQVKQVMLENEELMDEIGRPTSGIPDVDHNLANERVEVQLTIMRMAYLATVKGASITLCLPKESVFMYQSINALLQEWAAIANNPAHTTTTDVPIEDLERLEAFAEVLYQVARNYMEDAPARSRLEQGIRALGAQRHLRRNPIHQRPEEPSRVPERHQPVVDTIATQMMRNDPRNRR